MRSNMMGAHSLKFGDGEHNPGDDHFHNRDGAEAKEQEWSKSAGMRPPLHLPMFVPCYDEGRAQHFLYHPSTGECIFIDNDSTDASGAIRTYSCWTRPSEPYSVVGEMRRGESEVRAVFGMHTRLAEGFAEERRKFESEEEACLAIQSFFRKVRDVKRYRDKIRTVFSKHYDEDQFLFFFVNTITGGSQWHRPAGLGGR